jgi:methylthioribose-1-phosphate isomerase
MPRATFDPTCPSGASIEIEERAPNEVRSVHGVPIAPNNVPVWNPGFDVTPAKFIDAWISEDGVTSSPEQLI